MDTSNSANVSLTDMEETRVKSKAARSIQHSLSQAMAEALYQPNTLTQPKPLASRVKDAGKEFLRHNQTCQWIQFIQEPPQPMENRREKRMVKENPDSEVKPIIKETDSPCLPVLELLPPIEASPSYEEQLLNVQKQQEELLEQQHRLEEQLEQQRKARQLFQELQPKQIPLEISEIKEPPVPVLTRTRSEDRDQPSCPPSRFRRRLKGYIAQSYAERDEGSIGSLLFNTREQEAPTEKKSCMSNAGKYSRPALEGRLYAISQESGSNISELLLQLPSSSSYDILKNASDSAATITETVMTDLTIKQRKDSHRDY